MAVLLRRRLPRAHPVQHADPDPAHRRGLPDADLLRLGQYHHGRDDTCPWQVNNIGAVQGRGRNYVLAVLTTDDPAGPGTFGLGYGVTTIQGVSQRVWANLAP